MYAYPRPDSVIWRSADVPAPARVLAFDDEAGTIAYITTKGAPARLDFRQGGASQLSRAKLTGLASADGSTIFAITSDGGVDRLGPAGAWHFKPPVPARAVFPQSDGTVLVLGERGGGSVVWRVRPPGTHILDSVTIGKVDRTLRTQVGDRLYLGSGRTLTGVRTRTMQPTSTITFEEPIEVLAATPSGDRVFVVTTSGTKVQIVDRYRDAVVGAIELGWHASDLRVDALGRYLLARPEGTDSAAVIALGTNRQVGVVATGWRSDLPYVGSDGSVALAQGKDVVMVDAETLRPGARIADGAADIWYPFQWTGFRARDARLDSPVSFAPPPQDSAAMADTVVVGSDSAVMPPAPAVDSTPRRTQVWTVSFAALLVQDRARELAAEIRVNGENARVVTATRNGAAVYRVVMGPYPTREDAERVGRESRQSYWVYEGGP